MVEYSLSELAAGDVARLYRYGIVQFGPVQADSYYEALFARFEQISEMPTLYPLVAYIRPGYRRSVFGGHSIYYRVMDDGVRIERVLGREDSGVLV